MIFWITFLDITNANHLGDVIIEGETLLEAITLAKARGCVPTSAHAGMLPPILLNADLCRAVIPESSRFRILSREEIEKVTADVENYVAELAASLTSVNTSQRASLGN